MRSSPCGNADSTRPEDTSWASSVIDLRFDEDQEQMSRTITRVRDVLAELHALLGDYSPMWFTEGENERTERALHDLNRLVSLYPGQLAERNA
jgi:hypothetical protein